MHPCCFAFAGSLYYKMWAGLNGFDPRNNLAFGGVRMGMGCMMLFQGIHGTRNFNYKDPYHSVVRECDILKCPTQPCMRWQVLILVNFDL